LPIDDRFPALFTASVRFHIGDGHKIKKDNRWTRHLRQELEPAELIQAVHLWGKLQQVHLLIDIEEHVTWRWTESGSYSAASAYNIKFEGAARRDYKMAVWSSEAPSLVMRAEAASEIFIFTALPVGES
jgi:hypothetical protein